MARRGMPAWSGAVVALALAPRAHAGVVLNELFADAASVDANCDGVIGTQDDEFVEVVNVGPNVVDLSGATVSDATGVQYTFPAGTVLDPNDAVVVFAGGAPLFDGTSAVAEAWCVALPSTVTVLVSAGGLSLNNTAETVTLADAGAVVLDTHVYGSEANSDASLTRDPDGTGSWAVHDAVVAAVVSPGTTSFGAAFGTAPPPVDTGTPPTTATGTPTDTGAAPGAGAGDVIVNEFVAAVAGVDAGYEWVEVLNVGPVAIELSGWMLQSGTSGTPPVRYTFPAYALAPGEHLVVGEELVAGADLLLAPGATLELGNATASGDLLRLVTGDGTLSDTVVYGPNNTDGFLDDSGAVATSYAPTPVDGSSVARSPDGSDTDSSGVDFVVMAPTPGAENVALGDTGDTGIVTTPPSGAGAGDVILNEIVAAVAGTDDGYEWVEVLNIGADVVALEGWELRRASSGTPTARYTFPAVALYPGERLVVGEEFVAGADLLLATGETLNLGNATASADVVQLVAGDGTISDTVVYGPVNTDAFVDDSGLVATSLAPTPVDGSSLSRLPDGSDTDASGVDFVVGALTLGAENAAAPTDTGDTGVVADTPSPFAGQVVVNELLPDPAGADGTGEWVELLNVSAADVVVDGWAIERTKSADGWSSRATLAGMLAPGERLLVGESGVVGADVTIATTLDLGNATGNADAVRLADADGLPVDTVVYGPNNDDGIADDNGAPATSLAPKPAEEQSLARVPDGADSNDSAVDFLLIGAPTPGVANLDPADACADGAEADGVVINEFDTNTTGLEWVEVYNGAAGVVDMSGWTLAFGTSSFSSGVSIPAGTTVEAGGFFVIGAIGDADLVDDLGLGNASSSSDGLRLEDCVGGVVDTVVYGQPNADGLVDDSGEVATSLAPTPASATTLARIQDGYDTDQCAADFVVQSSPSPGASNPLVEPIVCVPSQGGVVINEIFADPEGSDEGTTEWVELYNAGAEDVSVAGWVISAGTQDFEDQTVIVPGGSVVPAGGWLVIGGDDVDEAGVVYNFELGNGTGGDGVRLFDCEGAVVDTVLYGDSAEDLLPDDLGLIVEPYGDPDEEESLARAEDGVDTNAAEDWDVRGTPTPGASNVQVSSAGGDDESAGCGCGGGGGASAAPANQAPGAPPGQGGCSTVPLPLRGFEFLAALLVLRRRRP